MFGALADHHGPSRVLAAGGLLLFVGTALVPAMPTSWGLLLTL